MAENHRYCIIMCGGIGSRFWPYSRSGRPKQFIDFMGTGRSLLQMTLDRVSAVVPVQNVFVVTNAKYASEVMAQLPEIPAEQILCEPARRNTAPCIAWATYSIAARDPEASVLVTPSDHLITREQLFVNCIMRGFDFVETNDALLTLGIKPTRPETGYGYIQTGKEVSLDIMQVKTFTEKPSLEVAKLFLESGEFLWNSGLFLWRASVIKEALKRHAADWIRLFEENSAVFASEGEQRFINANFASCPSISIDFAVMEKASNVYVERTEFGWSDLGTWGSLFDNSPKNSEGNVHRGDELLTYDAKGNIFTETMPGKLIVACGLEDYIVSDSDDVLLICPRSREQEIKRMVTDVTIRYNEKYT